MSGRIVADRRIRLGVKIFLGLSDIASQISDLSQIFEEKYGYETLSYHDDVNSPIIKKNVDVNLANKKARIDKILPKFLNKLKYRLYGRLEKKYFLKAKNECDVFIFFWKTFRHDSSDLKELKEAGKKIIICYTGDEARWYPSHKQQFEKYGLDPIEYDNLNLSDAALERKLSYIRNSEKYADAIFSRLDQHQLGIRPYYRWNMMVNASDFQENKVCREKTPIITHAPSSRSFKGTKYVLKTLQKMKNDGHDFEIQLVEGKPYAEAVQMYAKSDIVIDQVLCPGSGKLATECLAMGKVVVGRMAYDSFPQNKGKYKEYPIVDASVASLEEVLIDLINNPEKRKEIASKSRKFVEEVLDYRYFCEDVVKIIEGKMGRKEDYDPDFFSKYYIPEEESKIKVHNKYLNLIKDCEWYRPRVVEGERNKLKF